MKNYRLLFVFAFNFSFTCIAQQIDTIKVKVHDHIMTLYSSGIGKPTVILEAGGGANHKAWQLVQPKVANSARVVSYDRPGYLSSDTCTSLRDAIIIAKELKEALTKANIPSPYIFVGWSYGGSLVRVFAGLYPKDVIGMVLVDPAPEEFYTRFEREFPEIMKEDEKYIQEILASKTNPGEREEMRLYDSSMNQARRSDKLHSTPTTLLIAAGKAEGGQDRDTTNPLNRIWVEELIKWASKRPNLKYEIITNSGHHMAKFQPDIVINAINYHIDQYQSWLLKSGTPSLVQFKYPVARKEAFDTAIYGRKLSDDYFWMSRKSNEKEVTEFSRQQGKLAQNILDSIGVDSVIMKEWDESFAILDDEIWNGKASGEYIYYSRVVPKEGTWYCRRKGLSGEEEKLLKSVVINGKKYSIRKRAFAHRASLIALMLTDQGGEANPHIRIYDMDKKEFLTDSIGPVMFNDSRGVSMAWLPDNKGILYAQAPPTDKHAEKYYNGKIKLHLLGNDISKDEIVFGIDQNPEIKLKPAETPYIYSFNHSGYLLARIRSGEDDNYAFAVHFSKLNGNTTPWKRLQHYVNLSDGFDANDKYLYAGTKDRPGYNIVKINMETGDKPEQFWDAGNEIISISDVNFGSGIVAGKNVLYVLIRRIADMHIVKIDLRTKAVSPVRLDHKTSISHLSLSGDNDLLFSSFSATRTAQYFLYSYNSKTVLPLPFADKVIDLSETLQTEVVWVPSRDGIKIPVSLVYKKGLNLKNNNPILIEGYGNGGAVTDITYDPNYQPWIKRGGIYAYAHVRGGGELGEAWIKDGQFPNKMNSINDIVDIAEFFVKNNYTSGGKQLVMGGSAGSFLVGNAINQRPDLFAGGIFLAGLPDLVTTMDAAGGREQKSTGLLGTKQGFESRYSVSSYYHIPPNKKLPAMLISHGATDYILAMHPVARYAAKLQEMQKGDRPVLFLVNWEAGHLGSQSELLYILKFALWQTGHPDFQLKK